MTDWHKILLRTSPGSLSFIKNSLISPPETLPDSGIWGSNVLISFRNAGHAVLTPFFVLGIRVVTIVAAQLFQLEMVFVKFSSISTSITQIPFTAFSHALLL